MTSHYVSRLIEVMSKRKDKTVTPRLMDYIMYPPSGLICPYCKSTNTIGSAGFYECLECDKDFNDGK